MLLNSKEGKDHTRKGVLSVVEPSYSTRKLMELGGEGVIKMGTGEKLAGAGEHSGQIKTTARDVKSTKVTLCLGAEGRIKMTTEQEM